MANSAGMCTSFKVELMLADHNFGTSSATRGSTAADTFKMALYQTTATIGPSTTAYTATGEVSSANYTAGGATVTNATAPTSSGTTAYWTPSASVSWTTVSFTTDCALLYNTSRSNKAVGVYTFGPQSPSVGNFTLTMPAQSAGSALVQVS